MKPLNSDFEKFLSEALELYEKGKPLMEILAKFPNHQRHLKEVFDILDLIKKQKNEAMPPKAVLSKILASLPAGAPSKQKSVTKQQVNRYLFRSGQKGRPSFLQEFTPTPILRTFLQVWREVVRRPRLKSHTNRKSLMGLVWGFINPISMLKNWKLFLPLGAAAVIILALVSIKLTSRPVSLTDLAVADQEQANLDDLGALAEEYLDEEMVISEDIDSNLDEASADGVVSPAPGAPSIKVAGDPLESAAIQFESQAIAFDADLDSFLAEEASLKEIDSSLTEF